MSLEEIHSDSKLNPLWIQRLMKHPAYAGKMSRTSAEYYLKNEYDYFVRLSESSLVMVISFRFKNVISHRIIKKNARGNVCIYTDVKKKNILVESSSEAWTLWWFKTLYMQGKEHVSIENSVVSAESLSSDDNSNRYVCTNYDEKSESFDDSFDVQDGLDALLKEFSSTVSSSVHKRGIIKSFYPLPVNIHKLKLFVEKCRKDHEITPEQMDTLFDIYAVSNPLFYFYMGCVFDKMSNECV